MRETGWPREILEMSQCMLHSVYITCIHVQSNDVRTVTGSMHLPHLRQDFMGAPHMRCNYECQSI